MVQGEDAQAGALNSDTLGRALGFPEAWGRGGKPWKTGASTGLGGLRAGHTGLLGVCSPNCSCNTCVSFAPGWDTRVQDVMWPLLSGGSVTVSLSMWPIYIRIAGSLLHGFHGLPGSSESDARALGSGICSFAQAGMLLWQVRFHSCIPVLLCIP